MSYTQPIFILGHRYRAKEDFESGPASQFIRGEVLVFESNSYSPYDNSFVYTFRDANSGKMKEWWLPEGKPKEVWKQFFEDLGVV